MASRRITPRAAAAPRGLAAAAFLLALAVSPVSAGERPLSVRVHGGIGFYLMSDMKAARDAWISDAPYPADDSGFRGTSGIGGEPSVYIDFAEFRGWTVGLGSGWMGDEIEVVWCKPNVWLPGCHQYSPEVRVACRTLELSATRRFPEDWGVSDTFFFRVNVGLGWTHVHGLAEHVSVDGNAVSPLVQAAVGGNFGKVWFFEPTFEVGLRYMRPRFGGGDVSGEAISDIDDQLLEFLDEGTADFTGCYVRIGLVFFK